MNHLFFECFYFALYEFGELLGLGQFYDDVAMEDAVVEDEVGKVVAVVNDDAFLAGLKTEAIAEFEEEFL